MDYHVGLASARGWPHGAGLGAMASDAGASGYGVGSRLWELVQVQLPQTLIELREGLCKRVGYGTRSLGSFREPETPFGVVVLLVLVPAKECRVHVFRIASNVRGGGGYVKLCQAS